MDSFMLILIVLFVIIYFLIEFLSTLVSLSDRMNVVDLYNKGNVNAAFIVKILNGKSIFMKSTSFNKLFICIVLVSFLWMYFERNDISSYIGMSMVLLIMVFSTYVFNLILTSLLKEPERVLVNRHQLVRRYLKFNLYYGTGKILHKINMLNLVPKSLVTYKDISIALSTIDKDLTINESGFHEIKETIHFNNSLINDSILTHRTNVFALNEELSKEEALNLISQHDFKRIPVYRGDIDKVIGFIDRMVFIADCNENSKGYLKDYTGLTKPLILPVSTNKSIALQKMLDSDVSICVVIDEYGGTEGIVTKNDLIKSRNKKRKSN